MAGIAPAEAVKVFEGAAIVVSVTPPCDAPQITRKVRLKDEFRVLWRPKFIDNTNGQDAYAVFLEVGKRLFLMKLPSGALPGGTYTATGVDYNAVNATSTAAYANMVQTPAIVSNSDTIVALAGRIDNFMFITGCTVDFKSSMNQRP